MVKEKEEGEKKEEEETEEVLSTIYKRKVSTPGSLNLHDRVSVRPFIEKHVFVTRSEISLVPLQVPLFCFCGAVEG